MRPKNLNFFVWGSLLFLIFLLLLVLETRSIFQTIDPATTTYLQRIIPRTFDGSLSLFTLLGNIEPTALLVLLVGLLIFRQEKRVYYPLILFGVIAVFEFIGKLFLYHPGPPAELFRFNLPFEFPHLYVSTSYSFPSGHVSRTTFLAFLAIFLTWNMQKKRRAKILLSTFYFLLLVLMVVSRVYLGEHWASDVLGGILLGGSMGLFSLVYY